MTYRFYTRAHTHRPTTYYRRVLSSPPPLSVNGTQMIDALQTFAQYTEYYWVCWNGFFPSSDGIYFIYISFG